MATLWLGVDLYQNNWMIGISSECRLFFIILFYFLYNILKVVQVYEILETLTFNTIFIHLIYYECIICLLKAIFWAFFVVFKLKIQILANDCTLSLHILSSGRSFRSSLRNSKLHGKGSLTFWSTIQSGEIAHRPNYSNTSVTSVT